MKLFNTYRGFASDEEREGISKSLQETEEWLYDDGEDETEGAYTSKLEALKKVIISSFNRRSLLHCCSLHLASPRYLFFIL